MTNIGVWLTILGLTVLAGWLLLADEPRGPR